MRNAFVVFHPLIGLVDGAAPSAGQRFVIVGSGRQSAGDGIEEHELQEADGSRKLRGIEPFDQFVRVLLVFLSSASLQARSKPLSSVSIVFSTCCC